jgi:aquaporin Z
MTVQEKDRWRTFFRLFLSEAAGTALLLLIGLSLVIVMFGAGSPMVRLLPSEGWRQMITGFLFGSTGALIAVSPLGKESGAHLNPVVTLAFWLMRKVEARVAVGYVIAQFVGASVGALPLVLWGAMGQSVGFGATTPGARYSMAAAVIGEVVTTFGLVAGLCVFLAFRPLRPFTPAMIPCLYAVMVPLEAAVSGTSTNPARTFGPALISGQWEGWWVYWVGPLIGSVVAIVVCSALARRIEVAKLYHFESDRRRLFHRMAGSN